MQKHFILSICFFLMCLLFVACHQYEEGPAFSIYSPENRLRNTWKYEQKTDLTTNTVQYSGFDNWEVSFDKNNVYSKKVFYLELRIAIVQGRVGDMFICIVDLPWKWVKTRYIWFLDIIVCYRHIGFLWCRNGRSDPGESRSRGQQIGEHLL